MRLRNKVALITGGAVGIGAEIAKRFAGGRAQVVIGDVNVVEARTTSESIRRSGGSARSVPLDVTKEESWKEALDGIRTAEGRLDVLVNNAGITTDFHHRDAAGGLRTHHGGQCPGVFLGIKHALPS